MLVQGLVKGKKNVSQQFSERWQNYAPPRSSADLKSWSMLSSPSNWKVGKVSSTNMPAESGVVQNGTPLNFLWAHSRSFKTLSLSRTPMIAFPPLSPNSLPILFNQGHSTKGSDAVIEAQWEPLFTFIHPERLRSQPAHRPFVEKIKFPLLAGHALSTAEGLGSFTTLLCLPFFLQEMIKWVESRFLFGCSFPFPGSSIEIYSEHGAQSPWALFKWFPVSNNWRGGRSRSGYRVGRVMIVESTLSTLGFVLLRWRQQT